MMTKSIQFTLLLVLTLGWSGGANAHPLRESIKLHESIKMVKLNAVNLSTLYVKVKDPKISEVLSFGMQDLEAATGTSLSAEPLFANAQAEERLERFKAIYFATPLSKEKAIETLKTVYSDTNVTAALFEPLVSDAVWSAPLVMAPAMSGEEMTLAVPDFESRQDYLKAAPEGIDAQYAWTLPGGTGKNIKIIDVESGWFHQHDDLAAPFWIGPDSDGVTDHSTSVFGELASKRDGKGTTGIVYDAKLGFISRTSSFGGNEYHANLARVIEAAIAKLDAGDLLVLELHSIGPANQYIPVEFWEPIYEVLLTADKKGVHCVAAAGNGGQDLDNPIYKEAFNPKVRDSGCVIVGASTHTLGRDVGHRAGFSDYGKRVDAYGFGEHVTSTGYGDLLNLKNNTYTANFSGTSSATPIVGGAIAALSSLAREKGRLIPPRMLREALRKTGTPQREENGQHIGNLPDIRALYNALSEYTK